MNQQATEHLDNLKRQIERADMVSIQTVSWGLIEEAMSLVEVVDDIWEASHATKTACADFRNEMQNPGYRPPTQEVERLRVKAVMQLKRMEALIALAQPSSKATILRIH